jgi:hypothetical protein
MFFKSNSAFPHRTTYKCRKLNAVTEENPPVQLFGGYLTCKWLTDSITYKYYQHIV